MPQHKTSDKLIHDHAWDENINTQIGEMNEKGYEIIGVYLGPNGDIIVHLCKSEIIHDNDS